MKVMIDANVFIVGLEKPTSNSRVILELIMNKTIESVFSDFLIEEISEYFRRTYSRNLGWLVSDFIRKIPNVTIEHEIKMKEKIKRNKKKYKFSEEDVVHFTVARETRTDYLISLNRHFLRKKGIKGLKILNSREFLEEMGIEPVTDLE